MTRCIFQHFQTRQKLPLLILLRLRSSANNTQHQSPSSASVGRMSTWIQGFNTRARTQIVARFKSIFRRVSSFVDKTFNSIVTQQVNILTNSIVGFATQIQNDPTAAGQAQNSYSKSQVKSFSIELNPENDSQYYGKMDGRICFSITPSSLLLNQSVTPFGINVVNPRVINVQAYWRGVAVCLGMIAARIKCFQPSSMLLLHTCSIPMIVVSERVIFCRC